MLCPCFRDDRSRSGHILGSTTDRDMEVTAERKLSPISNAVLRLITHLTMFIGANYNLEVSTYHINFTCLLELCFFNKQPQVLKETGKCCQLIQKTFIW